MVTGITEIAIVILLASVLGYLARRLNQPTILAYIFTGVIIASFGFFNFDNQEVLHTFSDMGIMFLLFLVGMEINYKSLRLVGGVSFLVGLGQIIFTFCVGFGIASLFGFEFLSAAYIAIGLTFSSTIIIVKLLSEKQAMNSLYGKISIGFLLVQDFVAILILLVLSGIESGGGFALIDFVITILIGLGLFGVVLILGRHAFPYIFSKIARSQELLFLSSLAWLFSLVAIVDNLGFSIEIGGFLAGLALANSSEHFEISSRVKPLRDFFIVVFFAILGSSVAVVNFSGLILPIILLSLFVLVGNPLIVMTVMGMMGYKKRTSFMSGLTVAQISEFSLILAALGTRLGHVGDDVVAVLTAVGVVTITVSTYFIINAEKVFKFLSPYLDIFEKDITKEINLPEEGFSKPIVLIGHHRTGESITSDLPKEDLLVIDFDPEIVKSLKEKDYTAVFGDVSDFELFEKVDFPNAKLVVSTSPTLDDNLTLLSEIRGTKDQGKENYPKIVVRAKNKHEAEILYNHGADYVLIPQFISGHYLGKVINDSEDLSALEKIKKRDLRLMNKDI